MPALPSEVPKMMRNEFNFCENSKKYEIKAGATYVYGTAGFRMNAQDMRPVAFRVGLLAALMSAHYGGKFIGVMVTASHNPVEDNGVKMIDPHGEMVTGQWEEFATELANTEDCDLKKVLNEIWGEKLLQSCDNELKVCVAVGRDTRPSGIELVEAIEAGIKSVTKSAQFINLELQTTPQCHFNVKELNFDKRTDYFDHFCTKFEELLAGKKIEGKLVIDAANGIGALSAEKFRACLSSKTGFNPTIVNTGRDEGQILNHECGADFVKIQMKPPKGVESHLESGVRFASLDGDADRLIYFYFQDGSKFVMLDGDRISVLFAFYLRKLLQEAGLFDKLRFGVVQTAYANGASTAFLESQGVPVSMACTGVKNLHQVAAEDYDIGVYFEANGHGTVLFNEKAAHLLTGKLQIVMGLINQCVGDAMSDLLLVEAILCDSGLSLESWNSLYTELPSRQLKVKVANRFAFKTAQADTKLTNPPHIQHQIDAIVAKYPHGRAFVRPSGTEDVVRIYAEAETRDQCDELAQSVANLLQ